MFALFRGTSYGGWEYQLRPEAGPLAGLPLGLVLGVGLAALGWWMSTFVDRRPALVAFLWLLAGTAGQLAIRAEYPSTWDHIVISEGGNSFWTVTQRYSFGEYVTRYHEIAGAQPIHAKANFPGKVVFFYLLEGVTASPLGLAYLILALSNLGGLLVWRIARELFPEAATASWALALYLMIPAKLYFLPLLNGISPLFLLFPFWLWLIYLRTRKTALLPMLGVSLYACFLFDPVPMVCGLIFAAFLLQARFTGKLNNRHLALVFTLVPGGFLLTGVAVWLAVGYDTWRGLLFVIQDAREYNAKEHREYGVWLVHNLLDFLCHAGAPAALIFTLWSARLAARMILAPGQALQELREGNDHLLTLAVFLTLAVLDLLGVNRGETIRLWIFLAVFLQIVAARACVLAGPMAGPVVLACTVVQASLGTHTVRWL
jgi:hypothetical protein